MTLLQRKERRFCKCFNSFGFFPLFPLKKYVLSFSMFWKIRTRKCISFIYKYHYIYIYKYHYIYIYILCDENNNFSMCQWYIKFASLFAFYSAVIYLLKVNNGNTRTRCKICSKLTIKRPERRHWRRSVTFIVNFEHISHLVIVFL